MNKRWAIMLIACNVSFALLAMGVEEAQKQKKAAIKQLAKLNNEVYRIGAERLCSVILGQPERACRDTVLAAQIQLNLGLLHDNDRDRYYKIHGAISSPHKIAHRSLIVSFLHEAFPQLNVISRKAPSKGHCVVCGNGLQGEKSPENFAAA